MIDPLDDATFITAGSAGAVNGTVRAPRQLHLVVVGGGAVGTHALPVRGSVSIGRHPTCDVCVDDVSVSRQHATLHVGDELAIEDLGSANGTQVGDKRVASHRRVAVKPGELIQLGSVRVVVQARDVSAAASRVVVEPVMRSLYEMAGRIAASELGVLVLGETGVGKEIFARSLHEMSCRPGAFVAVNCAALSDALLESELFGHEKGAFTNAVSSKVGILESADGGTVLLDEVGDMPLSIQAKLLRVIEDRQLRRVGGLDAKAIDVRFVAATNRDLEADIERGAFRRDLYFRLNGVTMVIPPLRERRSEIEPLARKFVERAAQSAGHPTPELAADTVELLRAYTWPGNIRELRNIIERAVLLARSGPIRPEHLPTDRMNEAFVPRPRQSTARIDRAGRPEEYERIVAALDEAKGNQTLAAKLLGVSRRTLINRLEAFGLPRPRKSRS